MAARNTNKVMLAPMVGYGEVFIWLESGVRHQFCVGAFGSNLASVEVKTFSHLIYLKERHIINKLYFQSNLQR
jgi:hypothetical protein